MNSDVTTFFLASLVFILMFFSLFFGVLIWIVRGDIKKQQSLEDSFRKGEMR